MRYPFRNVAGDESQVREKLLFYGLRRSRRASYVRCLTVLPRGETRGTGTSPGGTGWTAIQQAQANNATASWRSSLGVSIPSGLSSTYTAPAASSAIFPSSNTANDGITATIQGSSPAVSAATSLTLVEPVAITNVSPASWTAGSTPFTVTITGTGFSAASQVTIGSPSWPLMTYSCTPTSTRPRSHAALPYPRIYPTSPPRKAQRFR